MNIPTSSYLGIALQGVFGLALPAGAYLFLRKKYGCRRKPFWIGCLIMMIFALTLEQAAHSAILAVPFGQRIAADPVLLALYGGIMAALFEEGGRFIAFRYILKDKDPNSALMYGAGHGGFEAFAVLGLAAVSNFACVAAVNAGQTDPAVFASVGVLANTPFSMFLLAVVERCAALAAQIGLSVLVACGVRKDRRWIALAFFFHFALDAAGGLLQLALPTLAVEAVVIAMAALIVWTARGVWRKCADGSK